LANSFINLRVLYYASWFKNKLYGIEYVLCTNKFIGNPNVIYDVFGSHNVEWANLNAPDMGNRLHHGPAILYNPRLRSGHRIQGRLKFLRVKCRLICGVWLDCKRGFGVGSAKLENSRIFKENPLISVDLSNKPNAYTKI
jgi:hypothetical protein